MQCGQKVHCETLLMAFQKKATWVNGKTEGIFPLYMVLLTCWSFVTVIRLCCEKSEGLKSEQVYSKV